MRFKIIEDLIQIYSNVKNIQKLYSANYGEIDLNKFHETCKNQKITLSLVKNNFNKVIGFLCPMNFMIRGYLWTKVTVGKTQIIYFDD